MLGVKKIISPCIQEAKNRNKKKSLKICSSKVLKWQRMALAIFAAPLPKSLPTGTRPVWCPIWFLS
jgi:hypothetical protein